MSGSEIVEKVKALNLPDDSYVVFGSCPLAIAGIREANDIDMLVSEDLFQELQKRGWHQIHKGTNDNPLVHDVFEAHPSWNFSHYQPSLQQLLANATVIDGIPIASLDEVRKWKQASGRPKDLTDLQLIDNYKQPRSLK